MLLTIPTLLKSGPGLGIFVDTFLKSENQGLGKILREEHQPFWAIRNEKILKAVDREDQRVQRDKIRKEMASPNLIRS